MATLRKLQAEIDKTLKKVSEGLEEYDDIFEQLTTTENSNLRDKYESNLKSELKRLQKYREQIKSWIGNNDVKEKDDLMTARRDIERRMEGYKAFEKEAKTKAYSKEGLQAAAAKSDPKERAKLEAREWLNGTVESMTTRIDEIEVEIEDSLGGKSKKKSKSSPRMALLEETMERHQLHVARLEQMLRLLDNDVIRAEDVEDIQELVDDYLERCEESPDEFNNPDDIYIEMLDILESHQDLGVVPGPKEKSSKEKEKEKEREREEKEREKQKAAAAAAKALLAAQGNLRLVNDDKPAVVTPSKVAPVAPVAAGPAVPPPPPPPPPPAGSKKEPESPMSGSGALSAPGTPVHAFAAVASAAAGAGVKSTDSFPALSMPSGGGDVRSPKAAGFHEHPAIDSSKLENGLDQVVKLMEDMRIKDSKVELSLPQKLQMLQISAPRSIPQVSDSRWTLPSQRPVPSPVPPPPSYPSQKLPIYEAPALFDKLDTETLMYAFYFQPASMQQLLAARSLKNKSWHFNENSHRWYTSADVNPSVASLPKHRGEGSATNQQNIYFDPTVLPNREGWAYKYGS